MSEEAPRFEFGKNWANYVETSYSEDRLAISKQHLLSFLGLPDLKGKYFLDIGCGSGLHSLAASRAGAERIVSLDYDPDSVATTRALCEREGSPDGWEVRQGSILDEDFVASLEPADIAYSWGVLHHTGSMWEAVRNAASLMREDGVFYVALYITSHKSPYWKRIKQEYNRAGEWGKRWMEVKYLLRHRLLPDLLARQNTFKLVRGYRKNRGMEFMTDVRDWLGGWPYEDCSIDEAVAFTHDELDLELVRILTGEACVEYLLQRRSNS